MTIVLSSPAAIIPHAPVEKQALVIRGVLKGEKPMVPQYHGWEKPEEAEPYFRKLRGEILQKGPLK